MPWPTNLLDPIPGDNPCGADIRHETIYKDIEEARREEVAAPQGEWKVESKVADWPLVVELASEVLAKHSKHLQVSAWLTEAVLRRDGLPGLKGGLDYIHELLDRYWDCVYPEAEDGDLGPRSGPLNWIGLKLEPAVKSVALNPAGHTWLQRQDSRSIPSEAEGEKDQKKKEARKKAIEAGRVTLEAFDKSVEVTAKPFYKQLVAEIDGCLASLKGLEKICDDKFGNVEDAPSFMTLRKTLDEIRQVVQPILKRKLELDPDPVEEAPAGAGSPGAPGDEAGTEGQAAGVLSAEPTSRIDAISRITNAARYLRLTEPGNPASYLLLRGLRWGELRARGSSPDPKLCEAPTTVVRTQLKTLLLDRKWPELLEAAETAMAQPCGRGWLDLQRYSVLACDRLGRDYEHPGQAIRGALFEYLAAIPDLPGMMMMDDTPTANEETRAWLRTERDSSRSSDAPAASGPRRADGAGSREYEQAMDASRAGKPEEAVGLLKNALAHESSARGRFQLKTVLAEMLVAGGREQIALPVLQELAAQVDAHKLEEWEGGEVVARPLGLLYRCLVKLNQDQPGRQTLYLRICRLDPVRAIECA